MRLDHLVTAAFRELFARLIWRALGMFLVALFALVALYHAATAGTIALTAQYGALYAQLIMAAGFAVAGLIALAVLFATRSKPPAQFTHSTAALAEPRNMQIAMLVEAVMLGYALARKSGR